MGRFLLFAVLFIFFLLLIPAILDGRIQQTPRVFAQTEIQQAAAAQQVSPCGTQYTVQPGDYLTAIAVRCQVNYEALRAANPQIINPARIFPGQVINIPGTGIPVTGGPVYVVQFGDTLFTIAVRHNTTVAAILAINPQITNPNRIFAGQVINLPDGGIIPPTGPGGTFAYTVIRGDTLFNIATRYGTTVQAIINVNPQITNPNRIFPGQVINVPEGGIIPPTGPGAIAYTVVRGDTLFNIATRYGTTVQVLLNANPQITNANRIFPGQVITIPR
jgi:tyrosinase